MAPWVEPDDRFAADLDALVRVQEAAERFRRSGVQTPLEGDEKRIFDAVVRPERAAPANGNVEAERARLRGEIERAEKMLSNERFVSTRAGRRGRCGTREAGALPP